MKKKILHLLAMNSFSGAENVVCQIIGMFSENDEVEMIYCSPDGPIRKALEERGVIYEPLVNLSVKEVRRVIKKKKPYLIHAHDVRASLIASVCNGRIPVISHMHNNWEEMRRLSVKSCFYMISSLRYQSVIWVSKSAYEQYFFKRFLKLKSLVLPNIININEVKNRAGLFSIDKTYDVVYVGRLSYQKNPERLVSVIERIVKEKSDVSIGIIGDGNLAEKIEQVLADKNLDKNVDLLGFIANPLPIVKSARAFIMTSRWEGTPMSVLESLALGTPIVSTPVDGLLDIIKPDINGVLSDNDDVLASSVVKLVNNKAYYDRLSKESVNFSEEYNSVENYRNVIRKIYKI